MDFDGRDTLTVCEKSLYSTLIVHDQHRLRGGASAA